MKILTLIGAFILVVIQINAQNVAIPSAGAANMDATTSDYVTVGSRLPYYVATDATIQTMTTAGTMKQSIFQWLITDASNINVPGFSILNYAGAAAQQYDNFRANAAGTGFYDNEISFLWGAPFLAGTEYKVKVTEKSVTLSPTIPGCLSPTQTERDIFVLAHPTVAFVGTEGGGCTVAPGTSYYVPLNITGLGIWKVTYTLAYNGGAASAPATYTLTVADPIASVTDLNVVAKSTALILADGTNNALTDGLKIDLPVGQYGYYDVAVTDITDRISAKAFAVPALVASPAVGSFRIYVSPVPSTNPIQHFKNL